MTTATVAQHTPGPWETKPYPYQHKGISCTRPGVMSHDGFWVATKVCGHIQDSSAWANAKLMAAAPQLLEALKLATRYLDHPDVRSIPFALSVEVAANRVHEAIEAAS